MDDQLSILNIAQRRDPILTHIGKLVFYLNLCSAHAATQDTARIQLEGLEQGSRPPYTASSLTQYTDIEAWGQIWTSLLTKGLMLLWPSIIS